LRPRARIGRGPISEGGEPARSEPGRSAAGRARRPDPDGRRTTEAAMIDPKASRFWHSALESGLVDAKALEACWRAIPEAKRTPEAIDRRLARQAVVAGYLTLWQAQQILSGRNTGYRIDKYLLLDRIGHGGMGRVYLAKDTRLSRRVAIKILSPERMNN